MTSTTTAPETTEIEAPAETWKGQSVPRKEDRRLVQGQGVFVDDIKRHGMGYITSSAPRMRTRTSRRSMSRRRRTRRASTER